MRNLSICFLFVGILAFSGILYAQDENRHYFVATTYERVFPEGGSQAELDSLGHFFNENAIKKNEFILSEQVLRHAWGHNSTDFVVIQEFKNWADIEKSGNRNVELIKEAIPDDKERQKYYMEFGKYFGNKHSDEIYQGMIAK